MSTIKTGWLKDKNGDKFAPKTLSSQVIGSDGVNLEDKIQAQLDEFRNEMGEKDHNHDDVYETKEDAQVKYDDLSANKADKEHVHSWNDLEDRPFGEEPLTETEVVSEATTTFEYNNTNRYYGKVPVSDNVSFSLEKTYTVVWDGVTYNNVPCIDSLGGAIIGSSNSDIAHAQNEYPFCFGIEYDDSPILTVITDSTAEVHTFKIIEVVDGYVKTIDEKYIPDTIARTTYVDENFALKSDLQNIDLSALETKEDAQVKYDEILANQFTVQMITWEADD